MSQTVLQPDLELSQTRAPRWMVVIYNNETNSSEQVIEVLIQATGCGIEEAAIETWEAHTFGKAPVHFSGKDECEAAAVLISSIGVRTVVAPEWND
jgi:ATP-dependent Clp protease adapter protein ClpS